MFKQIARYLAKREAAKLRQHDISKLLRYRRYCEVTPQQCGHLFTARVPDYNTLQNMPANDLRHLSDLVGDFPTSDHAFDNEIELKRSALSNEGECSLSYHFDRRRTFYYVKNRIEMNESEKLLFAYANIGFNYGFYNEAVRDQLCWVAIKDGCDEWYSAMDASRLSRLTCIDFDVAMVRTVQGSGIKNTLHAWGVFIALLTRKRPPETSSIVAARLIAEARAISNITAPIPEI